MKHSFEIIKVLSKAAAQAQRLCYFARIGIREIDMSLDTANALLRVQALCTDLAATLAIAIASHIRDGSEEADVDTGSGDPAVTGEKPTGASQQRQRQGGGTPPDKAG